MTQVIERKAKGASAQFVFDALRREILDLDIEPGAPLDEMELSRRFGVSRSPVREALVRLGASGLVETLPNRSAIAARVRVESLAPFLAAQKLVFRVTAREAAKRINPSQLALLEDIQSKNDAARAQADTAGMIETNRQFHTLIAQATGNPWYVSWLQSLMDEGQRILTLYMRSLDYNVPRAELQWHHALLDALKTKDPDAADLAAKEDADVVRDQLINMLSQESGETLALD
ncbi:MAG: GntR family transcriptional regulator [Pseudomonadota bacterium]